MWPFGPKAAVTPPKAISYDEVRVAIDGIEAELRRINYWTIATPTPEAMAGAGAFGQPTLAFEQWLVHVFVPRVRSIIESQGAFPTQSHVGDQAFREWKMWGDAPGVEPLIEKLRAFDAIFNPAR